VRSRTELCGPLREGLRALPREVLQAREGLQALVLRSEVRADLRCRGNLLRSEVPRSEVPHAEVLHAEVRADLWCGGQVLHAEVRTELRRSGLRCGTQLRRG
jgi:hypothetical protein